MTYKVGDKVLVAYGDRIIPGVVATVPQNGSVFYSVVVSTQTLVTEEGLLPYSQQTAAA